MAERTVTEPGLRLSPQLWRRFGAFAIGWPAMVSALATVAIFIVTYVALDQLDHIGPTWSWPVAPWNPELGLCIAAALRWRAKVYPLIFLAPIFANLLMPGGYDAGDGVWTGAVTVLETLAITFTASVLTTRVQLLNKNPLAAILIASLPCALVAAAVGAARLAALDPLPTESFGVILARLWVGDVIGVFIVTPLFHIDLMPARALPWKRILEIAAQGAVILLTVWLAFSEHPRFASRYFYGVFPPMIWIGLRFGMRGAIIMNALVQASMIISLSVAGHENFDVTIFQALLLVLAASGLTLGMVVDQNKVATAQLHAREEELAASLRVAATGELAGTLAHELGHPLGAISNYAAALNHVIREVAPDSEAPKIGAKLSQEIVRATDTLHRLREFFRTGSLAFEPLDLGLLMKDATGLLKERLSRNVIAPHISIPSSPTVVLGDQIQLRAVIYNLMVNAIDALKPLSSERRILSVTLRRAGDMAVLEVEDSGGGVAADVKDNIFEPLVTTKKDGLGLGLSMSRSVVEAHGGSIVLRDSVLGGAKFVVTLPPGECLVIGGRTVGIIDDDEALRDSLALVLRFRNFDVLEFASGEELLAAPALDRLDCMILDLRMTGVGGLEVLESCIARGVTAPIIVVTAFGNVASATHALKSGAFDFLEKPVHEEQMLRVVNEALSRADHAAALRAERLLLTERLASLSGRERQVLDAVLEGRHNREIAAELKLSVRTIEIYKGRVMEKMNVSRLAELIRLFARLEPMAN